MNGARDVLRELVKAQPNDANALFALADALADPRFCRSVINGIAQARILDFGLQLPFAPLGASRRMQ